MRYPGEVRKVFHRNKYLGVRAPARGRRKSEGATPKRANRWNLLLASTHRTERDLPQPTCQAWQYEGEGSAMGPVAG